MHRMRLYSMNPFVSLGLVGILQPESKQLAIVDFVPCVVFSFKVIEFLRLIVQILNADNRKPRCRPFRWLKRTTVY